MSKSSDGRNGIFIGSSLANSGKKSLEMMNHEILRFYVTYILAVRLQMYYVVEDVLTIDMMIKLMHYLKICPLDEIDVKIGLYVKVKRKDEEGVAEEKDDRTIVKASKMEKLMKLTRTVEVDEFKRQSKDKQKYLKQRVIVSGEWFEHSCLSRKKDGHL